MLLKAKIIILRLKQLRQRKVVKKNSLLVPFFRFFMFGGFVPVELGMSFEYFTAYVANKFAWRHFI